MLCPHRCLNLKPKITSFDRCYDSIFTGSKYNKQREEEMKDGWEGGGDSAVGLYAMKRANLGTRQEEDCTVKFTGIPRRIKCSCLCLA